MKIAVLSDIHDNLWNLQAAIATVQDADALICCGDLCSPFVVDELANFPREVHVVFGNNDADLFRITAKAAGKPRVKLYGEFFAGEFGGRTFAVNHFDYIARPIAKSGQYEVVCFGHNHEFEIGREGRTLLINPGPIMGAKFSKGWQDVAPTFVVYDSEAHETAAFKIDPVSKRVTSL
jgi:hypothetical protein